MTAADFDERGDHTSVNRATYDRIARRYFESQASPTSASQQLFAALETSFDAALPSGAVVADMGCGPGLDAARWANRGHRVVGLDLSAGMLAVARERLAGRLVQADLRANPFGDGRFDGIWCVAALLHVPEVDTVTVLTAFRRTLRRTGTLALVTALGDGERFEDVPYAPGERRWFVYRDVDRLVAQLAQAGFVVGHQDQVQGDRRRWSTVLAAPR
jgi:ubiquinone/menaquinone biosynthesis C-methylase UbiE